MDNDEMMKRFEVETGKNPVDCIDISVPGRRILAKYSDEYVEWLALQLTWIPVVGGLPKKGQTVLATYLNSYGKRITVRAVYIKQYEEESDYDDDEATYEYCKEKDAWYLKEGWYELIDNWPDYSSVAIVEGEVDYWLPMPQFKGGQDE